MLYILFGLPGAGKTYTGKIFQKHFGFHFYDGDSALPKEMRNAIHAQQSITDDMRDIFFKRLEKKIAALQRKFPHVVIAQTYIKEKYRRSVLDLFPEAKFNLIKTKNSIRETRLLSQNTYPLTLEYVRKMIALFEQPTIQHVTILNNIDNEDVLIQQIQLLLAKNK